MKKSTIRPVFSALLAWLEACRSDPAAFPLPQSDSRCWNWEGWEAAQQEVFRQGIGPYLFHELKDRPFFDTFPVQFQEWLAYGFKMNAARLERLRSSLVEILNASNLAGVRVMPLKGFALLQRCYPSMDTRPMADIDLLVTEADFAGLQDILIKLGYQHHDSPGRYANHHRFNPPGESKIASTSVEHPDNPRPVEVHTEIRRTLWGSVGELDLTDFLWQGAKTGEILGQSAWIAEDQRLLEYLACHALQHLLIYNGRLLQFLDLALLLQNSGPVLELRYPQRVYPVIRLAQRALPGYLASFDLSLLEESLPPALQQWADTIPLDERCGLVVGESPERRGRIKLRWERWALTPHKIALAYGDTWLLAAYFQHLHAMTQHMLQRLRSSPGPARLSPRG